MPELTQQRLRELLDYDPETGFFNWKVKRKGRVLGRPAGTIDKDGYVIIGIIPLRGFISINGAGILWRRFLIMAGISTSEALQPQNW